MPLAKTTQPAASRIPSAAEFVNSLAAIAAPNASVDSMDPCTPTTKPGGTFVLGTPGKHLTDSADLGLLCSYPGTLTFKVSRDAIFVPLEFTVDPKGPGAFPIGGPVPEAAATFTWSGSLSDYRNGRAGGNSFSSVVFGCAKARAGYLYS